MTTAAPWGRAYIHPECPEERQIRLESGGEAERSPNSFFSGCKEIGNKIIVIEEIGNEEINIHVL